MKLVILSLLVTLGAAAALPPDHAEKMARGLERFRQEAAPLLREHCVGCHGGEKTRADFDLTTREGLLRGGKEGEVVKPFDAAGSRLMKLIRHQEDPPMPDKKPKLPDDAIAKLAAWIDLGAPYDAPLIAGKTPPRDRSIVSDEDRKWWAFQPLADVRPPAGTHHPVDAFLLEAAKSKGLAFNPPAKPATLVRRASLDLTGLPPTPEEMERATQNATFRIQDLIDRLLASTAYGERWARYWLDVARFAESSGFEHDYDRTNAFHYRDFVIRALNADLPFDQFARWQLAGDEFAPGNPEAMMATGFLGAGVFPTQITANEVERTRYDALDDMLSTTGNAFLGLTLGCARCHDHKFDPIPTQDYYRLLSTFTTVVRSDVELDLDPAASARALAAHEAEKAQLKSELVSFEALREKFDTWLAQDGTLPENAWSLLEVETITSKAGAKFEKLEDSSWLAKGKNGASDVYTMTGTTTMRGVTRLKLEALTHESAPHQGPGRANNGNFALSRIRLTAQPRRGGEAREVRLVSPQVTHEQNNTGLSVAGSLDEDAKTGWAVDSGGIGKDQAAAFTLAEPVDFEEGAKLVVTLEFEVNTGHNLVRPRFSVSAGAAPDLKATALPAAVAALAPKLKLRTLTAVEREVLFDWWKTNDPDWRERQGRLAEHARKIPRTKTPVMVCAEGYPPIVMHSQGPPFLERTHILRRGDANQKQNVADQGFLQVLMRGADEKRWQWTAPAGAAYSGRRRSLANWLTDTEHGAGALMARVQVNRVWQHHFGRGLVATPNDFGRTGALPSHPALLDWLAGEFIRGGWRLKPLHRLMMTSKAYAQGSRGDGVMESWSDGKPAHPNAPAPQYSTTPSLQYSNTPSVPDPDNALFLRRVPQRLESEAVRDSMLAVSGVLDRTMFGKGTLSEESKRRSIYFTVKRSRLMNSMVVFDAPEPLTSQGTRPTTTVAPQALLMMNSPQVRGWAGAFARRVESEAKSSDTAALIARAYLLALARPPRPSETQAGSAFINAGIDAYIQAGKQNARTLALTDFCQAVLALNEFVYVD